jgi:dTDP-4-dehydrorhamnose 3,5-epimerase
MSGMTYQISPGYVPELSAGVRWDDPEVGVRWPLPVSEQSDRDLKVPPLANLDPSLIGAAST